MNETAPLQSQERAEPGEKGDTELFSFFSTPSSAFNSWGVGISLYFSTLRAMALALFIAGLISLTNIVDMNRSAICEDRQWAMCETGYCNEDNDFDVIVLEDANGNRFVERFGCNAATSANIARNLASMMFLVVATLVFGWYQTKRAIVLDEDKLTSSDYSIRVLK